MAMPAGVADDSSPTMNAESVKAGAEPTAESSAKSTAELTADAVPDAVAAVDVMPAVVEPVTADAAGPVTDEVDEGAPAPLPVESASEGVVGDGDGKADAGSDPDAGTSSVAENATASPARARDPNYRPPAEVGRLLGERFPALFGAGIAKPIKLRIQVDLQARAPGLLSRKSLSIFLQRHTTTTAYLRALIAAEHRFDLDGQPAGEIATEHRAAAQIELDRRRLIVAERRAAERGARPPRGRPMPGPGRPVSPAAPDAGGAQAALADSPGRAPRGDQVRPERAHRDPRGGPHRGPHRGPHGGPPESSSGPGRSPPPQGDRRRDGPRPAAALPTAGPASDRPPLPSRGPRDHQQPAHRRPPSSMDTGSGRPPHAAPDGQRGPRPGRPPDAFQAQQGRRTPDARVADAAPPADTSPDAVERRNRAQLLYAFEASPLSKANFCALKRLRESEFDALIAQARAERSARAA